MSHFTNMKTSFQNLDYLQTALDKIEIKHYRQQKNIEFEKDSLVIPQSNGYDIEFRWNGQEYDLVVDMSFWEQPYPVENLIDKVSQQYASEVIISESQKLGFKPIKYQQNQDGSNTFVLERWNQKS